MMERTGQQLAATPAGARNGVEGDDEQSTASLISSSSWAVWLAEPGPALAEAVTEALLNNETFFFRDRLPSTCS
jgi:hypothetical protein